MFSKAGGCKLRPSDIVKALRRVLEQRSTFVNVAHASMSELEMHVALALCVITQSVVLDDGKRVEIEISSLDEAAEEPQEKILLDVESGMAGMKSPSLASYANGSGREVSQMPAASNGNETHGDFQKQGSTITKLSSLPAEDLSRLNLEHKLTHPYQTRPRIASSSRTAGTRILGGNPSAHGT